MNPGAIFSEVKRRLLEELDYRLEADHQRFFRDLHSGDPRIFVPAVVDELSKVRVLTTELAAGDPLEAAAARPEPLRRTYAETLWRFVFKGNLVAGRFNADPHPGNYLFRHDGSIVFLDFGLVQPLEDQTLAQARDLHRSALERDEARFAAAVRALLKTRGGSYEELSIRFSRRCFEPLFESPFHITRRYVSEVVRSIYEIKQQMFARDKSFVQFPPELVFINRLQFGFYSVLARLDVSVDYAQVERQLLDEAHL
jgi:predicted unusual protein kinase regulating ubiquinone biosynthesis (AarF/ABC1/UbiB family)